MRRWSPSPASSRGTQRASKTSECPPVCMTAPRPGKQSFVLIRLYFRVPLFPGCPAWQYWHRPQLPLITVKACAPFTVSLGRLFLFDAPSEDRVAIFVPIVQRLGDDADRPRLRGPHSSQPGLADAPFAARQRPIPKGDPQGRQHPLYDDRPNQSSPKDKTKTPESSIKGILLTALLAP